MLATDSDKNIVIVGAGIIGVCTAYYLALELHKKAAEHHPETIPQIILVEEAESPAPGASGKAAGFLAKDWHSAATQSLGELSFNLHLDLASKNQLNGKDNYGFREIGSFGVECRVPQNLKSTRTVTSGGTPGYCCHRNKPQSIDREDDEARNWIDLTGCQVDRLSESSISSPTTAQVLPLAFVTTLFRRCREMGVKYIRGRAESVTRLEDDDSSVKVVNVKTKHDEQLEEITCYKLVLCCGPWTRNVSEQLFGKHTRDRIQVKELPGQSIVLKPKSSSTSKSIPSEAIFASLKSSSTPSSSDEFTFSTSPEIFARPDGSIYVAGDNVGPILPSHVEEVNAETKEGQDAALRLFNATVAILPSVKDDYEIANHSLCYRPVPSGSRRELILGQLDVGSGKEGRSRNGNVFVSAGHGPWGISLGPGTGKCLAELVLTGKITSADVGRLQL